MVFYYVSGHQTDTIIVVRKEMDDNYNVLIRKLDEFIRKYYKNLVLKGFIYSLAVLMVFYLLVIILEHFAHFGIVERTIVFYAYLIINAAIIWKLIVIPVLKLFKIGRIISHEQAAEIIGDHFSAIDDKLLNTLHLKKLGNEYSKELIEAGINQKISALQPIPFTSAINLSGNKKYIRYILPPLAVIVLILVSAPGIITGPTERIVKHYDYFEKEKPFELIIINDSLKAIQQEDFILNVQVEGDETPDHIMITIGENSFRLSKENKITHYYRFKNIQRNTKFILSAGKVHTKEYEIIVFPKPIILNFEIELDYPAYILKEDEVVENMGDVVVPEGSVISWRFYTRDTESLIFSVDDQVINLQKKKSNAFNYSDTFYQSTAYSVKTRNKFLLNNDSLFYLIKVIPDQYPTIVVEEYHDSVFENRIYFRGVIKDDYGFTTLTFNYKKHQGGQNEKKSAKTQNIRIDIRKSLNHQQFFHFFDMSAIDAMPGDEIEYYFEVWDNDGVNGSKSSKSHKMFFKIPSLEEIDDAVEQTNADIKDELRSAMKDIRALQKELTDLSKRLMEKSDISWQEKQQIQDLLDKQAELQNRIENIQKQNSERSLKEQQYKKLDEEIIEKQRRLEELFEELMTDEMKELFEELQKMLEEIDKDKVNEMLEKMKWTSEDIEEQLDRSLELFKRLELEKKLNETIEKIEKLAEEQDELSDETENSKKNELDSLIEKQEEIEKQFDEIKEDLDDLQEKNNDLEEPNKFFDTESEETGIDEELDNSMENLREGKKGKSSKSQKSASEKMGQLGNKLFDMMSAMQAQGLGEDIYALREILENLLQVSFDQEDLIGRVGVVKRSDPKYLEIIQNQKKLKDDMEMIEDSLIALGKRQVMVKPVINRELREVNINIEKALKALDQRRISVAKTSQQLVMTSVNNLALLLSEVLEQMEQQMSQMASGGSSCPNPGVGASSISTMKQLQEQLNKQLEQMKSGKGKKGKTGLPGGEVTSEQFARLAAEQEAIRNQFQKYLNQLKEEGVGADGNARKMIDDMEKTERDLVNKMISNQTLMRQRDILTRLLQSEKAELKRKEEEKRESREAKNQKISNPEEFFKYKSINAQQVELLKTIPPSLKPFYKKKLNNYLFHLEE
ncbi:MAG: hypothetical protein KAT48_14825 [Bacteroidales bacterium]|nr:hypothetical protein [Bacteroidales bacterium]